MLQDWAAPSASNWISWRWNPNILPATPWIPSSRIHINYTFTDSFSRLPTPQALVNTPWRYVICVQAQRFTSLHWIVVLRLISFVPLTKTDGKLNATNLHHLDAAKLKKKNMAGENHMCHNLV